METQEIVAEQPKAEKSDHDIPKMEWDSEEGRKWRAETCGREIREIMAKYECILGVPVIDTSTGGALQKIDDHRYVLQPVVSPAAKKS